MKKLATISVISICLFFILCSCSGNTIILPQVEENIDFPMYNLLFKDNIKMGIKLETKENELIVYNDNSLTLINLKNNVAYEYSNINKFQQYLQSYDLNKTAQFVINNNLSQNAVVVDNLHLFEDNQILIITDSLTKNILKETKQKTIVLPNLKDIINNIKICFEYVNNPSEYNVGFDECFNIAIYNNIKILQIKNGIPIIFKLDLSSVHSMDLIETSKNLSSIISKLKLIEIDRRNSISLIEENGDFMIFSGDYKQEAFNTLESDIN